MTGSAAAGAAGAVGTFAAGPLDAGLGVAAAPAAAAEPAAAARASSNNGARNLSSKRMQFFLSRNTGWRRPNGAQCRTKLAHPSTNPKSRPTEILAILLRSIQNPAEETRPRGGRRRSNRPGNSQATGLRGVDNLERGARRAHRRGSRGVHRPGEALRYQDRWGAAAGWPQPRYLEPPCPASPSSAPVSPASRLRTP